MEEIKEKVIQDVSVALKCQECGGWESHYQLDLFLNVHGDEHKKNGFVEFYCPSCRRNAHFVVIGVVETVENTILMSPEETFKFNYEIDYKKCIEICKRMATIGERFPQDDNTPNFMALAEMGKLKEKAEQLFNKK